MKKLNVAILEDDIDLLKDLYLDLKTISSIEVLVKETSSQKFLDEVKEKSIDFLILDIDLQNDSKSGIDVANKLKLPVLFITGKTREFIERIESINIDHDFPVEFITKPASLEKLNKMISKMFEQIVKFNSSNNVKIKPKGKEEIFINPADVSFIYAENGDHTLYFNKTKPITVTDKTFSYFVRNGFPENKFYKFGKSYLLNIALTSYTDSELSVSYIYENDIHKIQRFKVQPDKRKEVKSIFLK